MHGHEKVHSVPFNALRIGPHWAFHERTQTALAKVTARALFGFVLQFLVS